MEVQGTSQEHKRLAGALTVATLLSLLEGPAVLFPSDFVKEPKANLWLFLVGLHSLSLEIQHRYN